MFLLKRNSRQQEIIVTSIKCLILRLCLSVIFIPKCAKIFISLNYLHCPTLNSEKAYFIFLVYMSLLIEDLSGDMRSSQLSVIISKTQQKALIGSCEKMSD